MLNFFLIFTAKNLKRRHFFAEFNFEKTLIFFNCSRNFFQKKNRRFSIFSEWNSENIFGIPSFKDNLICRYIQDGLTRFTNGLRSL